MADGGNINGVRTNGRPLFRKKDVVRFAWDKYGFEAVREVMALPGVEAAGVKWIEMKDVDAIIAKPRPTRHCCPPAD